MEEKTYTLQELATLTGTESRTIRSYIQQGLLRGPKTTGRYAYYDQGDLTRLKAIRVMKDLEGLKMADIRMNLITLSEMQILEISSRFDLNVEAAKVSPPSSSSALEYLNIIKGALGGEWTGKGIGRSEKSQRPSQEVPMRGGVQNDVTTPFVNRESEALPGPTDGKSSIDELLYQLGSFYAHRPPKRKSRGEPWFRIPITPDLELSVRGMRSPEELAKLERLADLIREILLGGVKHGKK